jgi:hypothetical protein
MMVPVAAGVLALTACVGGPPSPEQIADEFATPIEPAWEVEVPGLYGDIAVRDGVVLAYAVDEEVGMRLTAHAAEDGELLWEHTASPGGAPANPLLSGVRSASRPYPIPTIAPLVVDVGSGDDAAAAVVFFERDTAGSGYVGDDFLRVADLRTGELLEVTAPDVDPDEFSFEPLRVNDDGELVANTRTIGYPCGERAVCFVTEDADVFDGYGTIRLDTETLEARYSGGHIPEPADGETIIPEWGLEYARVITDSDVAVARYRDGAELWRVGVDELFGVERTSPPDEVDFVELGGLVLIQGYQPLLETLARDQPHTLSIDYVASRTLVAVDAESGEVVWRLPGGDLLCHAVHERPIPADAETVPVCVAHGGGYVYDIEEDTYLEQDDFDVAIAELTVADGELDWTVEGAGDVSIAHVVRLLWVAYATRGDLTVVEVHDSSDAGVLDLRDGAWHPIQGEELFFVCKEERDDVELEFEGSVFAGGGNAITTGYPAGWQHFPCDFEGRAADTWTKGGVRLAGIPAGENRVVLPLEGSLAGFRL